MKTFDQLRDNEPLLLKTKVAAPLIPAEYVKRPRLTEKIQKGTAGPLIILAAPAGFGKTNLLVEWMKSTQLPVAWLNIDPEDNDVIRFFAYLISALQTLNPAIGEEAADYILASRGSGLETGLTLLVNELASAGQEMVLVLDDLQVLEDKTILKGIGFLIKHLPHNVHLIISSRVEPELEIASMRAKGRVTDIGMEDLRFTSDEVNSFFQDVMNLSLPPETLQTLEVRTDGWVTGMQMAAITLQHQLDPNTLLENLQGPAHYLVDFLAEEVLDHQSEEIRQFLLRSSVLDTLNGSLCEAVVNPEAHPGYGTVILTQLEHNKLFITSLDEKHEWFQYHNLFRDFLRHVHAEVNQAEIPLLKKRASIWFENAGNLDEAFKYALASGDMEWTSNLIERNVEKMIKTGEIFPLTHWIERLPDELILKRPVLCLVYAWGLIASYQIDNAKYWIENIQLMMTQRDQKIGADIQAGDAADGALWNIRGGVAICQSMFALLSGDPEKAADFSKKAGKYLGEENPFIHSLIALDESLYFVLSGDTQKAVTSLRDTIRISRQANNLLVLIIATCQLAEMQALQGQLGLAWTTLEKAQYLAIGPDGKPLQLAGLADMGFGEILLERNSLDEAGKFFERGIKESGSFWWLSNLDGLISLAHLSQAKGDLSKSREIIAEAARIALSSESSQWDDTMVSAVGVRMALHEGDLPEAEQWWRRGRFPDLQSNIRLEDYPYHIYEYLVLTQARLLIAFGMKMNDKTYLEKAQLILEPVLIETIQFQRVTSRIEILILQAVIQLELGDISNAVSIFRGVLAMGEAGGYRRIFLDGGRPVFELLNLVVMEESDGNSMLPSHAFLQSLITALENENGLEKNLLTGGAPTSHLVTSDAKDDQPAFLSVREIEVLTLIAEGKSNQEISSQLYLALNTVKRHAYNIYTKLGVEKRTQAVSKARQLGLIP